MAIEIHIRVRDTDWDRDSIVAYLIAEEINNIVAEKSESLEMELNIPVLVLPVEDPENEMEPLIR